MSMGTMRCANVYHESLFATVESIYVMTISSILFGVQQMLMS
uniref:Uncharacterized protein n=1 Tax=Arundo donax TaxID=35708 RepID=A0A0A8Z177_ARUDO